MELCFFLQILVEGVFVEGPLVEGLRCWVGLFFSC